MAKKPGARKKKQKTAAEMGSRPVQERDTGPGGMTATGSKTRRKKPLIKTKKKPLSPKTPAGQRALKLKKQKTAAEMGSRPVQERDTGLGGMTSGGPTTRRKKPVIKTTKKIVKRSY